MTHAIALLMWLTHMKKNTGDLQSKIRTFSTYSKVGFPLIDGNVRRKKDVYFSDYDKVFNYRSDKSCAVPDQCVPIMYTREMHDRVKSFSNCCIIYIKGLYFTTRLVTKMSFLMTPPPLEQHAAKTRSAGKRGGELGVVSKIWAKKPAAEITDIPDPLLVD
jgi:hypothetical protein